MSVSGYHGGAVAHRGTAGAPVIFVVEDDWRTRHFICTVLKYSARALVIEFSSPQDALAVAREHECGIDMLIASLDWDDSKPASTRPTKLPPAIRLSGFCCCPAGGFRRVIFLPPGSSCPSHSPRRRF